jgi:hypothetical protein
VTKIAIIFKTHTAFEKIVIFAGSKQTIYTMKKLLFSLSALACLVLFNACNTKVDLYADYKDIPVIYGLLDVSADTNFIKIVRAFSGSDEATVDATQVALIPDSCNYPGKLDAKIYRYKRVFGNEYALDDTIVLDTITIHDKEPGTFYYPDQKVYYTTEPIWANNGSNVYYYRLEVVKANDTVSAETGVVGGENFKITNTQVSFVSEPTDKTGKITFFPADNASVYNMELRFTYKEIRQGQVTEKTVVHSYGMKSLDEINNENGSYYVNYSQNLLFNMLNSAIGGDTLHVSRTFVPSKSFVISLAAAGDELFNYIQINQGAGGLSQNIPDYTNINGGYGVFSSRLNIEKAVKLSSRSITDLIGMPWGFSPEE